MWRSLFLAFFLWGTLPASALEVQPLPQGIAEAWKRLPIQHNGRVKPFESFARESLRLITGSERFGGRSAVETVLHMTAFPEKWEQEPVLSVPYRPLRESLGLSPKTTHLSYQGLFGAGFMKHLPPIVAKQDRNEKLSMLENETMELYFRFTMLHALFNGDLRLVPSENRKQTLWLPLTRLSELEEAKRRTIQTTWQNWLSAYREGDSAKMQEAFLAFEKEAHDFHPEALPEKWRLQLELLYHQMAPLRLSWMLYGLSFLLFGLALRPSLKRMRYFALFVFGFSFLVHSAGILTRVILAGRPPVSNFYESMLWLAWMTVLFGFFFEWGRKSSYFGLSAALFGGVTLLLSEHLPLDPSIQPIVAVLRSNKWLSIHVLTVVSSYGALTLAAGIAHVIGVFVFLGKRVTETLGDALYRVIQLGVVLLAAGTMLGAVWANASWGRYWGWDPKETWALITLLWFLALLHARKADWIGTRGLAAGTILGFFLMLMTYYGVSFYLIGLHSYAGSSAKPVPPLLIGYAAAECAFLAAFWTRITFQKNIKSS